MKVYYLNSLQLYCLIGIVRVFDIMGKQIKQLSLISEGNPAALYIEAHFWGNGIAAISSESIVYVAEVSVLFIYIY